MHEQIFKAISIYGNKVEIRITGNAALIAIDDADGYIVTTDLVNVKNYQNALV